MLDDHVHKKLFLEFMDNLKLQKMQYVSLHYDIENVKDEIENTKSKQKELFDERLPCLHHVDNGQEAQSRIKD